MTSSSFFSLFLFIRRALTLSLFLSPSVQILEEFGKSLESEDEIPERDAVFASVHKMVEDSARENRALKGSLFWNWESNMLRLPGNYEVDASDSTFQLVRDHAQRMKEIQSKMEPYPCDTGARVFSSPL